MQIDVYPSDADVFEAVAQLIVTDVAARGAATVFAIPPSRVGRGILSALASRTDMRWDRVRIALCDVPEVPDNDPTSAIRMVRETLGAHRPDVTTFRSTETTPELDLCVVTMDDAGAVAGCSLEGARGAGATIVLAIGHAVADAVARTIGDEGARGPSAAIRPSSRCRWVIDRAAADVLLRDATPA